MKEMCEQIGANLSRPGKRLGIARRRYPDWKNRLDGSWVGPHLNLTALSIFYLNGFPSPKPLHYLN